MRLDIRLSVVPGQINFSLTLGHVPAATQTAWIAFAVIRFRRDDVDNKRVISITFVPGSARAGR
jgi:hypothetical protein